MDSGETCRHQRTRPRWRRGECATTGADQTLGPRPVTLSSKGRPLLAVSGSPWGPADVSSHVLWIVGGRLPLRVYRGPGPVRASVHLSQVLVEAGVTPAVHTHGPAPLATPHHNPYSARLARSRRALGATEVAVRACVGRFLHIGGRRAATTPWVTVLRPGPWSLAPRSRKGEGRRDATRITRSGVCNQERQGCSREVSAQGEDEHLTTCSEPDTISISTLVVHRDTADCSLEKLVVNPTTGATTHDTRTRPRHFSKRKALTCREGQCATCRDAPGSAHP